MRWLQRRWLITSRSFRTLPEAHVESIKPRLLLLAPHSSYRIAPYLRAAQRLNLDLLIASTSEYSLVSAVAEGLRIDFTQPEAAAATIQQAHQQRPFCGVVASDDLSVHLAATVAAALGLPHNSPQSVQLTQRKDLARNCLLRAGVPVPQHQRIDLDLDLTSQLEKLSYPAVIKPLNLSGSRGVIRVNNLHEATTACARIEKIVRELPDAESRRFLLAEDFIAGREVAVEAMLSNGKLHLLALFDKPDDLNGPYFEETYYITPSRLPGKLQQTIMQRVQQACTAYGLEHGPVHAELRVGQDEAWILEVAARTIGGQCARLLQFGTGFSLEELVLAQAMGKPLEATQAETAGGILMIPIPRAGILRRVEGIGAARRIPGIEEVEISVRDGYELVPLPEGSTYLGFIFARGENAGEVEVALRQAHAQLRFITVPVLKIRPAP